MNESEKSLKPSKRKFNSNLQRLKTPEQRFFDYVDKTSSPNGCWLWTGTIRPNGYGSGWWLGKPCGAHRVSWLIHHGKIPDGLCVLHNCRPGPDNKSCVNPKHLWLGTDADNGSDRTKKRQSAFGARNGKFTHPEKRLYGAKNGLAKLSDEMVREIRKTYAKGNITMAQAGKPFGIKKSAVGYIIHRETWTHI